MLQAGQCVYSAIATAAANPPQPVHCHHASDAVSTFPVTMQLNAGSDASVAISASTVCAPRALNASVTVVVES